MVLAACGNEEEKAEFVKTLNDWIESSEMKIQNILVSMYEELGFKLIEALYHFEKSEFDQVVETLYPIRGEF